MCWGELKKKNVHCVPGQPNPHKAVHKMIQPVSTEISDRGLYVCLNGLLAQLSGGPLRKLPVLLMASLLLPCIEQCGRDTHP